MTRPSPTPPPRSSLEIATTWPRPDTCLVRLVGELDMSTGPLVRDHLRILAAGRPRHLVLDLTGVELFTAAGISALIAARRGDDGVHGRLHVVAPADGTVRRVLRLTGVDAVLRLHADAAAALADVDGAAT